MSRRAALIVSVVLGAVSLVVGVLLPDPMPSHWNTAGEVDGTPPDQSGCGCSR